MVTVQAEQVKTNELEEAQDMLFDTIARFQAEIDPFRRMQGGQIEASDEPTASTIDPRDIPTNTLMVTQIGSAIHRVKVAARGVKTRGQGLRGGGETWDRADTMLQQAQTQCTFALQYMPFNNAVDWGQAMQQRMMAAMTLAARGAHEITSNLLID